MMNDAIETFEDLEVWKHGCNLTVEVHVALAESKECAVRNQKRSSLSIPSNIAEGCERSHARFPFLHNSPAHPSPNNTVRSLFH